MGKKLPRFFLSVGLVLYLFDLGSDIYVAVQHWKNNETWWFRLTVGFITGPSLLVNSIAIIQMMNIWTFIAAVLQLSMIVRYIEAISSENPYTYFLAKVRYLETITESAPQWCLQVYIMLRQWHFPSYTVVSTILSMLSLTWSITILEKERRNKKRKRFNFIDGFTFFNWQLYILVSRLFSIALFAYVFRYNVIIPLAGHWLILVGSIFLIEIYAEGGVGKSLLLSMLAGFPSLIHSAKTVLPVKRDELGMKVGYFLLILTTIAMVVLPLVIEMPDARHMDVLQPIAIASVAGVLPLSCLLCCCISNGNNHNIGDDTPITMNMQSDAFVLPDVLLY